MTIELKIKSTEEVLWTLTAKQLIYCKDHGGLGHIGGKIFREKFDLYTSNFACKTDKNEFCDGE
ncbi:hypothetical protein J6590_091407 [Homalodisca vitripennis]|nr:hypothetical protein J6590_091407 [Homalodisca vitripennis]